MSDPQSRPKIRLVTGVGAGTGRAIVERFIPQLIRAGGGSVVNSSSVVALQGGHPMHIYSAAEGATLRNDHPFPTGPPDDPSTSRISRSSCRLTNRR